MSSKIVESRKNRTQKIQIFNDKRELTFLEETERDEFNCKKEQNVEMVSKRGNLFQNDFM